MSLKVFAFTCGWITLPTAFFLVGADGAVTVPVPVYFIDHPNGRALFDTGLGLRFQRARQRITFGASRADRQAIQW